MRKDGAIVFLECMCYVAISVTATLSSALAQWTDKGTWPPTINWVVILGACFSSAAGAILAFLSASYSTHKKNGNELSKEATEHDKQNDKRSSPAPTVGL